MSTGVLFTDFRNLHAAVEHLAAGPVWTHQLPAAMDALRPALLDQFPFLAEIPPPPELRGEQDCLAFLAPLIERYGDEHRLVAVPSGWGSDPLADAVAMMGGDSSRVLPVVVRP